MKIILKDMFDRETVADRILVEHVWFIETAREIADKYNSSYKGGNYFAQVVEDDYKLWRGMEELV